jgi:hypothetical protein
VFRIEEGAVGVVCRCKHHGCCMSTEHAPILLVILFTNWWESLLVKRMGTGGKEAGVGTCQSHRGKGACEVEGETPDCRYTIQQ